MSALKKEMQEYISVLPDNALMALKPLITLLMAEESIAETDLTAEEKAIITRGRIEYKNNPNNFVPLESI